MVHATRYTDSRTPYYAEASEGVANLMFVVTAVDRYISNNGLSAARAADLRHLLELMIESSKDEGLVEQIDRDSSSYDAEEMCLPENFSMYMQLLDAEFPFVTENASPVATLPLRLERIYLKSCLKVLNFVAILRFLQAQREATSDLTNDDQIGVELRRVIEALATFGRDWHPQFEHRLTRSIYVSWSAQFFFPHMKDGLKKLFGAWRTRLIERADNEMCL